MILKNLRKTLIDLRDAIREADGEKIRKNLEWLDQLTAEQKRQFNPHLVHFLQQRSYEKALAFLEGAEDIPAGVCGGVKK